MKQLALIFFTMNCFAQAPMVAWQKGYGGTNIEFANKVIQTSDGGYLVAGATASNDGDVVGFWGYFDFWILKLNATGDMQWQQTLGGNGDDKAFSAVEAADGGFLIVGQSNLNEQELIGNHGDCDYCVVKLSSTGLLEWQKSYGGLQFEIPKSVVATTDGYVIAGSSNSTGGDVTGNHSGIDYWVIKIDFDGNLLWQKSYGGSGADDALYIQSTHDGGFVVAGNTNSNDGDVNGNHGDWDSWIIKLDSDGNLVWQKTFGGSEYDGFYTIEQTSDNGFILGGNTQSQNGDVTDNTDTLNSWFVKTDAIGTIEWQKCLRNSGCDNGSFIHQAPNGGFIIAGAKYTNNTLTDTLGGIGNEDIFIGKINASGNLLWTKILGSPEADFVYDVIPTNDGGYVAAGSMSFYLENFGSNSNLCIAKLNADQLGTDNYGLNQFTVYPNPAKNQINLKFPDGIIVDKLLLIDLSGKIIFEQNQIGAKMDIQNLSNGIYLVQAFSGKNMYQSKFIKE